MLTVHRSNRLERLVELLGDRLEAQPLADPMALERVAVPSRGSERWVSQRLASRLGSSGRGDGVAAGLAFPFPGRLVDELVEACLSAPAPTRWGPDELTWPILEVLEGLCSGAEDDPRLEPLAGHLRGAEGPARARRLPLARRVADVFDRYALLRPRMVEAWEDGVDAGPAVDRGEAAAPLAPVDRWQPALWRRLSARLGASPAARRREACRRLAAGEVDVAALPPRISVFGVTALPPAHLEVLAAVGAHVDVDVHLLVAAPLPTGTGSPLRASLGAVGDGMAWALGHVDHAAVDHPEAPEGDRLLAAVQADLHDDRPPAPRAGVGADGTVQVHRCHGPRRQVEALRDVLAGLLEEQDDLEPRDVLVMSPDLDVVAPLLTAVFGPHGDAPELPLRVADRRLDAHNAVAGLVLSLLDLAEGRATASAVLDVIGAPPVRARFRLEEADVERLTSWVRDVGVRWGIDADDRAAASAAPDPPTWADGVHTWQAGLDRLRLGAAMADEDDRRVGEVVPFDHVEGDDVDVLGRAAAALETLFAHVRALAASRTAVAWRDDLLAAVEALADVADDDAWQHGQVRGELVALAEAAGEVGERVELSRAEARGALAARLGRQPAAAGYASGAITACELAPLRAVPHRVVCLVGLDDGAFPRSPAPLGFDLLAAWPQPADRAPRDEDRQLLLDAVMAARRHLVVTYTGMDPRTGEARPPPAPVAELVEAVEATAGASVVVDHPLHRFDPRCFAVGRHEGAGTGPPRGFAGDDLAAARAMAGPRTRTPRCADGALPAPEAADVVDLAALSRTLRDPVGALLRERLGVAAALREGGVDDRDPFDVEGLVRHDLRQQLLRRRREGAEVAAWRATALRRGLAPSGAPGHRALDEVEAAVEAVIGGVEAEAGAVGLSGAELDVDLAVAPDGGAVEAAAGVGLDLAPLRLVGRVPDVVEAQVILAEAAAADARRRLEAWLRLLAAAAASDGRVRRGVVVGVVGGRRPRPDVVAMALPEDDPAGAARQRLAELCAVAALAQRRALPLLPRTAAAHVEAARSGRDPLGAARRQWEGDQRRPGEGRGDAMALAYGADVAVEDVVDAAWVELARLVWAPVLAAQEAAR